MKVSFVGDIHGLFSEHYLPMIEVFGDIPSFQVGDMGHGFPGISLPKLAKQHKFIRGNHDNPKACKTHPNYLGDYGYLEDIDLFYFSGASSIDRAIRTEGFDWWAEEELSMHDCYAALELYCESKPRVVLSHDAPQKAVWYLWELLNKYPPFPNSRTVQILQQMLDRWQPSFWFFGHHHVTRNFTIDKVNTLFTCLGTCQYKLIDL